MVETLPVSPETPRNPITALIQCKQIVHKLSMSQDHLSALIDISKKLKLQPKFDIETIKNSWLMKPLRRASSSNLLEEITEYAMRRRGSRDVILDGAEIPAAVMRKKISCSRSSLAEVTECVESEKNTTNDPTFGMSLEHKLQYVLKTLVSSYIFSINFIDYTFYLFASID